MRERVGEGERETEREKERERIASRFCAEPNKGLDLTTVRS